MTRKLIPFLSAMLLLGQSNSVVWAANTTSAKSKTATAANSAKAAAKDVWTISGKGKTVGYEIEQRLEYEGILKIQTSALGTRVQTKDLMIFLDPQGKMPLAFNPSNKKYCVFNKAIWQDRKGSAAPVRNIQTGRSIDWQGHKVTLHSGESVTVNGEKRFHMEFWTASDFKVPQKVLDDYLRFLGLPPGYGFPIYMVRTYATGRKERFLNTKSIKAGTFDVANLRPPTETYTKAANEMEVVLGTPDELDANP